MAVRYNSSWSLGAGGTKIPRVIAHRGASMRAPENTLAAFQAAIESGADMIETDARLTHDGSIVLIHDDELGRTTDCSGSVREHNATSLAACDAGYWFKMDSSDAFTYRGRGLQVPHLIDLLDLLQSQDQPIMANIEIKNDSGEPGHDSGTWLPTAVARLLKERHMTERIIVSSFDCGSIDGVKAYDPSVQTAYLCMPGGNSGACLARVLAGRHDALHLHHSSLPPASAHATIGVIHNANIDVNVWTVNDSRRWRELAAAGVDGIITDDPAGLRRALETDWEHSRASSRG